VGEALANGLVKKTLIKSIEGDGYVIVRRLKDDPGTMKPVVDKAEEYLSFGNRYGYEQLLLLAFLGLSRKLQINKFLEWLLRKILDKAAAWLMAHGDRQPMICSEFAYRCYDEALPVAHDPYALEIQPFPHTMGTGLPGIKAFSPVTAPTIVHRDSLLAWTEDVVTRRSRSGSNVLLHTLRKEAKPIRRSLSAEEKKISDMSLGDLAKNYLEEAKKPTARVRSLEASIRSPEMLGDIVRFSQALTVSTKVPKPKVKRLKKSDQEGVEVPEALENLMETAADFVTPGDLYKCQDLFTVGSITP
jgi:hypothetical protein